MDLLKKLVERDQWAELMTDAEVINGLGHSSHIEVFAFSEDEAVRKACQVLHANPADLEYELLTTNIFKFFGLVRVPSRFRFNLKASEQNKDSNSIDYAKYNALAEIKNGSFRIQMKRDGLHLMIFPPEKMGKSVQFEDILQELVQQGYQEFNRNYCKEAIYNPNKDYIIAPYVKRANADSTFSVTKASDDMSASITISRPKTQGRIPDISEIIAKLKDIGVIHGIKENYITEILDNNLFDVSLVIAEGTPVEMGQDAYIEDSFSQSENIKHAVRADGSVDFKELNIIHNVHEGDILATMYPATKGTPGRTVSGSSIPTTPGKEIEWNLGQNVAVTPDKKHVVATMAGQFFVQDKKLCVDPALEISSDVDLSTGNIDFLGNIIIKGNVTDGFNVISGGNIEIHGHIGKCFIQAAGNIIAHQGIQGKDENCIECKGDLYARFVERSNVFVGGNIFITKALLHSNVICEKGIYVFGDKKPIIAGGDIKAKNEIISANIGAESYIETLIEVGYSQELETEIAQQQSILTEKDKQINSLRDEFASVVNSIPREKAAIYEKKIAQLTENRKHTEQEIAKKRRDIHDAQRAASISGEQFMPGVKTKIATQHLDITMSQSQGTLTLGDNKIVFGKYKPSPFFTEIAGKGSEKDGAKGSKKSKSK
ncbi:MAG: FapA family protein [Brevinema sp.]